MDVEAVAEAVAKVYLARVRTAAGLIDEMRSALIKYAAVRATYLRRTLEESLQSFSNEMGFFAFAEKARAQTRKRRPAQPYSSKAGRCFYNALDYVHRHQGANLAYGYEAETRELQAAKESYIDAVSQFEADRTGKLPLVSVLDVTVHAFVEEGGVIVDPTLGSQSGSIYFYRIVPESTWRTFNYQENDDNYDATDFARFVWGSIRVAKTTRTADILQRRLTPRGDGLTWAVNVGRGRVPMLTVMRAVDDVLELAQHDAAKAAALGLEVAEVPGSRDQVVFDLQRGEVQVSSGPVAGLQSGGWPDPEVLRQLKGLGFRPVLS